MTMKDPKVEDGKKDTGDMLVSGEAGGPTQGVSLDGGEEQVSREGGEKDSKEGEEGLEELQRQVTKLTEVSYSIFTLNEKKFIVVIASLAALFSPLSANIYYPALNSLAEDLNVTNSLINLSVTTYLIFQGLAPMFIGAIADAKGRRPAYIICFTIYLAACIGLALQSSYPALMVLRCLQSSGSSGTVALATAVVADCVTSAERGTYMGYALMGGLIGPALGPVIGGLLNKYLGWRSIFWFLVVFGGATLSVITIFLPETARNVVGNGALPAQRWNISLMSYMRLRKLRRAGMAEETQERAKTRRPEPMKSIRILFDRESGPLLFMAGVLFGGFYMVITSLPSQLASRLHYNTLQIGLVYIPTGLGSMTAAITAGKFLDWNFRRHAKRLGIEISKKKQQDLTKFPIEMARLQITMPFLVFAVIVTIAYGWVMQETKSVGAICVLLYFLSFTLSASFQGFSTLVIDLNRSSPGAATGAMNLARCWMGAAGVALVGPLLDRIGNGWTAVLVIGSWVLTCPIVLSVVMKKGPRWREEKKLKELKEEKKSKKEEERRAASDLEMGENDSPNGQEAKDEKS